MKGLTRIFVSIIACTGPGRLRALCILFLLVSYLLSPYARAAFSINDKGTSSAQFLKLGAGARAAGMGEAYASACDDATAVYWNPGALGGLRGISGSFTHASLFGEINYGYLGYAQNIGRSGTAGLGLQYLSAGKIAETDPGGFETGSDVVPRQMAVSLAYGREFGRIGLGVSAKYIRAKLTKTASTLAADAGISGAGPNGRLRMALVVQNIGRGLRYDKSADPLPANIVLGGAYLLSKDLIIGLDVDFPRDNRAFVKVGTEYVLHYGDISYAGRFGYHTRTLGNNQGVGGISLGLGIAFHGLVLDYAFLPHESLGNTQRISMSVKLGSMGIDTDDQVMR